MKAAEWFRQHKKLIIVIALTVLLIAVVIVFFGSGSQSRASAAKSATELRLTALLERMDGIGEAEVMVNETDGVVTGVVVVCDGADSISVRNDILNAVATALDINRSIIAIYSM